MKKIILLFVIFNLLSCKNDSKEILEYDKEGNVISKMYVSNGDVLDSIIYFKNGVINKSFFYKKDKQLYYFKSFTSDGRIISEGNIVNKIKNGKWKYYDSNDRMRKIVEFKNISDEEYPNQEWNFDENKKIDINKSNYFSYKFENPKFESKKINELTIKYIPLIKKGTSSILVFSPDLNERFSNTKTIGKDSIGSSENFIFKVNIGFENAGKHNFRGYIVEYYYDKTLKKDVLQYKEKKTYIDIPITVN
jgi:hypothetical protein